MANTILIKGKTTTGSPSLAQLNVREMCFVIPDNTFYIKKDAGTIVGPFTVGGAGGSGDMLKSVYDVSNLGRVDLANNATLLGGVAAASYATNTSVTNAINALVNSAPGALDTLNELAIALGNDPNFAATITASLATKLDVNSTIDGGTF
jgi:hypothetical protein